MMRPLSKIGLVVLLLWILTVVDAFLPQAQMVLFDGQVPFPNIILKLMFAVLAIVALLQRQRFKIPKRILWSGGLFFAYLYFNAILISGRFGYSLFYILFSYNAYYFYMLAFPIAYVFRNTLRDAQVGKLLLVLYIPLALLGCMQYFLAKPLLPVISNDGYFKVLSWDFYGKVRAFSFFSSSSSYGHFVALVVGFVTALLFQSKKPGRIYFVVFLATAFFACFTTLTRATYFEVFFSLMTAILFVRSKWSRECLASLAVMYGLSGFLLAYCLPLMISPFTNSLGLFASDSLMTRYAEWVEYGSCWLGKDAITMLFGSGMIQNDRFDSTNGIVVDNIFLAVGLHIGLVGLILCLVYMWAIWHEIVKMAKDQPSPLAIGVAAFLSTWLFTGMFNITLNLYPLVAILLISVTRKNQLPLDNPSKSILPVDLAKA